MTIPRELRAAVIAAHRAFIAAHGRGPRRKPLLHKLMLRRAYEEANRQYFEAVTKEVNHDR